MAQLIKFPERGHVENPEEPKQEFVKESEAQEKANESGRFKRWLRFADIALGKAEEIELVPDEKDPVKDPDAA